MSSDLRSRFNRQRQKRHVRSLRHRPGRQSQEEDANDAPRVESGLERTLLLVSHEPPPAALFSQLIFNWIFRLVTCAVANVTIHRTASKFACGTKTMISSPKCVRSSLASRTISSGRPLLRYRVANQNRKLTFTIQRKEDGVEKNRFHVRHFVSTRFEHSPAKWTSGTTWKSGRTNRPSLVLSGFTSASRSRAKRRSDIEIFRSIEWRCKNCKRSCFF